MTFHIFRRAAAGAFLASAAIATPALGQQAIGGGFSVTGSATAVTDYRFRGISLTEEQPALQLGATLNHDSGLYVGTWGSNLADTDLYGQVELNFFAGYTREVAAGTVIDVGLLYYVYPGSDDAAGDANFFEPYASIAHTVGPVTLKVGGAYAWDQGDATGGGDNVYVFGDANLAIPDSPVTLVSHIGYSDGSLSPTGSYTEWRLGLEVAVAPATLGFYYVDTDLPDGPNTGGTAVFSLRVGF